MKKALVIIDMQNDFVFGSLGSKAAEAIIPALRARIAEAQKNGETIVFTRDTHEQNYMQTQEGKHLPVPHCISGSKGHEIVADLQVENAVVFDKPTFGSVSLAEYLQKEGFEIVEFCGVCTDICVVSNVLLFKAYCPEREIIVQSALTAGTSEENTKAALLVMRCCHVEIL